MQIQELHIKNIVHRDTMFPTTLPWFYFFILTDGSLRSCGIHRLSVSCWPRQHWRETTSFQAPSSSCDEVEMGNYGQAAEWLPDTVSHFVTSSLRHCQSQTAANPPPLAPPTMTSLGFIKENIFSFLICFNVRLIFSSLQPSNYSLFQCATCWHRRQVRPCAQSAVSSELRC